METTGEDFGELGSRYDNGGDILCGGGASGASICVREVGNDPSAGDGPQGFPPLGGTTDGGNDTQTSTGWDISVPTHWGRSGNVGAR